MSCSTIIRAVLVSTLVCSVIFGHSTTSAADGMLGSRFLPDDALVMIDIQPAKLMSLPETELYPWEVAQAWCEETFDIPLDQCERFRLIVGTPAMAQPLMAAVIAMRQPVSAEAISKHLTGAARKTQVGQIECLAMGNGSVMHQFNDKTIIVAAEGYLTSVVRYAGGNDDCSLGAIAAATPNSGQVAMITAIEPIRPMVVGSLQMMQQMIPPPMQELTDIPNLLDSISVQMDAAAEDNATTITLGSVDAEAAIRLEQLLDQGMRSAQNIALAQIAADLTMEPELAQATMEYATRVTNQIRGAMTPDRDGSKLIYHASVEGTMPMQLVAIAALLPAIRSARNMAEVAASNNQLKQLGLGMHNYHSAYNHLPEAIYRDADGKPLLSWRVHLLPFLDEVALYNRFHLDEAWDSPHNIKLLPLMPSVYVSRDNPVAEGMTTYQVPVGDGVMFAKQGERRFRDITDGMSNSIMIVQTKKGVQWTKPSDWEIDLNHPLDGLFFSGGVAQVLYADGSAQSLGEDMDAGEARAKFTIAGQD